MPADEPAVGSLFYLVSINRGQWSCFGVTLNNFVVFLGAAKPQKSRLFERGTSEFRDFGVASLRKTRNYSPERKTRPFTSLYSHKYAE